MFCVTGSLTEGTEFSYILCAAFLYLRFLVYLRNFEFFDL